MDPCKRRVLEEQRDYYKRRAVGFDEGHPGSRANRCHRAKLERVRRHLRLEPGGSVLEVGAGTGIHAAWLLELCPVRYVGVDLSPGMLIHARHRLGPKARLVESAAEELPFGDRSFDAVYCSGTLHHVADKAQAIAEMRRVTRPGGRIVVSEPNPWNPVNAWAWMTNSAEHGQLDMRPPVLKRWFESAGISVEVVDFFNFTPPLPVALARPFDLVDLAAARLPMVRRIASMVLIAGAVK